MPVLTLETAEDALVALVKGALDGFTPSSGYDAPQLRFSVDAAEDRSLSNPPSPQSTATGKKPFVRFTYGPTGKPRTGIRGLRGGGRFERAGVARCDVFTPKGWGKLENHHICMAIEDKMHNDTDSGFRFEEVRTREIGSDKNFFHQVVLIDWFYTEHKGD